MTAKHWKIIAIALVAANVIYWLIMPAWNWKSMVELELIGIKQAITQIHPELTKAPPIKEEGG